MRHCQNPNSQYCQRHQVHLLLRSRHVFWGKPIVISPSVSSICQRSPYALNQVHLSTTTVTIIPPNRRRFMYARLFTGGLILNLLYNEYTNLKKEVHIMQGNNTYRAGLYLRLSKDDEQQGESVSIGTQRSILTDFCKANNYNIYKVYIDDGYSGLNFERPGFCELLEDVEHGLVNMVITKDLSRLGRDYIMTGYYPPLNCTITIPDLQHFLTPTRNDSLKEKGPWNPKISWPDWCYCNLVDIADVIPRHLSGRFLKSLRDWDYPNNLPLGVQRRCLLVYHREFLFSSAKNISSVILPY